MRTFIITQSEADLTSNAGLALVGRALNRYTDLRSTVDREVALRHGIAHGDVLASYIGLLCLGKNDFEAIHDQRDEPFFAKALGLDSVPSEATLRHRCDRRAGDYIEHVRRAAVDFLANAGVEPERLDTGHVPLDADVTPLDNSQTRKEGVSRTYKGHDGYAPMAAYLGREGYCLEFQLREGSQHCQKGTPAFLERVLGQARRVTDAPILLRLDGGNDALENIDVVRRHNEHDEIGFDYLIKWNPRGADPEGWRQRAEEQGLFEEVRDGKRVAIFDETVERTYKKQPYWLRRVVRVVERRTDRHGQPYLVPDVEVEGWWTSLLLSEERIIELYADHGTSEQFHSEFKTDLDIERLPSGKFSTNALVLACATLAFNILRWIGQHGLRGRSAPVRHKAKRRRLRTVIQELMYLAARVVESGRRLRLAFGRWCFTVKMFRILYDELAFG